MYRSIFFTLVCLLAVLGCVSIFLLYYGFDPDEHPQIALVTMIVAVFLASSCLLTLILYGVKKIISRGFASLPILFASFRQGVLVTLYLLVVYTFDRFEILAFATASVLLLVVIFLELILDRFENR